MLDNFIHNLSRFYAHTHKTKEREGLFEHSLKITAYYDSFLKETPHIINHRHKMYDEIFSRMLSHDEKMFLDNSFRAVICYHDIGKINPLFQLDKMGVVPFFQTHPNLSEIKRQFNSNHSLFSSVIFLFDQLTDLKEKKLFIDKKENRIAKDFLLNLSYIISKHHSSFAGFSSPDNNDYYSEERDVEMFVSDLIHTCEKIITLDLLPDEYLLRESFISKSKRFFSNYRKYEGIHNLNWFLQQKILFSLLITSDFYATFDYMNLHSLDQIAPFCFSKDKKNKLLTNFLESSFYSEVSKYRGSKINSSSSINELRSVLFFELFDSLKKVENKDKRLFFVEAPTGSGKTLSSFHLAAHLLQEEDMNKLLYVFPFNTLIDQTKKVLDGFLTDVCDSVIVNSTTSEFCHSYTSDDDFSSLQHDKIIFDSQMMRYPITLTSHVKFLDILFGTTRSSQMKLHDLQNAIIIIDEVQSYKIDSWEWFVKILSEYAHILNWKVLIMSATLPPLDTFLKDDNSICYLLEDCSRYFTHPLFSERVSYNYSYFERNCFDDEKNFERIKQITEQHKNDDILIECLSKKKASHLFHYIRSHYSDSRIVLHIDSDHTSEYRSKLIEYVKDACPDSNLILVATQVIEAGVDIDFSIGIKDVSFIESEEQFAGRINRSNNKKGVVYFVNLANEGIIYKEDIRKNFSLNNMSISSFDEILRLKQFKQYYSRFVFSNLKESLKKECTQSIHTCDFKKFESLMKQIDDNSITFFLDYFDSKNNIHTKDIFKEYTSVLKDYTLTYAERSIKLDKLKPLMDKYSFNYKTYSKSTFDFYSLLDKKINTGVYFLLEDVSPFMASSGFLGESFFDSQSYFDLSFAV